ncbi:hypothetical protein NO460_23065 [Xanthomonas oryzae pv. oryzae]|nr:hypothetical protein NO460_23065 [Xanthomonas oryzae pv. oryzae]
MTSAFSFPRLLGRRESMVNAPSDCAGEWLGDACADASSSISWMPAGDAGAVRLNGVADEAGFITFLLVLDAVAASVNGRCRVMQSSTSLELGVLSVGAW